MKRLAMHCAAILLLISVSCLGCGGSAFDSGAQSPRSQNSSEAYVAQDVGAEADAYPESVQRESAGQEAGDDFDAGSPQGKAIESTNDSPKLVKRRIIYTATVRLIVKEFEPVESAVRQLVEKHNGFLASSDVDAQRGEHRNGNWVIRVPSANYSKFLGELSSLGSVTTRSENAQDVTEEFVDLEARISNKKKLEERIVELLEKRDDKIKDVIEVEKELGRVREEIERMQGRMRYLRDRTSLATVKLHVVQQRDYEPPAALSFGDQIGAAWSDSIGGLVAFGKGLLIFCVAIAPWAIVALVVLIPIYLFLRRKFKTELRV